jgi:uncharacterized repeat protein (TIGR02543 family)
MKLSNRKLSVSFLVICLVVTGLSFAATVSAQQYPYGSSSCRLTVRSNIYGGWVYPSGENYYYYGSEVTIRESTDAGYVFVGWFMNGQFQGKLSTITLTMDKDYDLYAVFDQRSSILTITTNPSDAGTTVPPAGIYNYTGSQSVRVYEYPATGNNFSGWYLDGIYQGLGTSMLVNMADGDHQLTAFFAGTGINATPTPTPTPSPAPTPPPVANLTAPTLSFYCTSSTTMSGLHVKIQGGLAINQTGVAGAGVTFSYSATGGATWHELGYIITGNDGNFSVVWMPSASGNYLIKGAYTFYANVVTIVNYAVEPNPDNQVFSISSNSTLSSLAFDSTASSLSFNVEGPSETYGYVQVCIPKTLLPDSNTLGVSLDGQNVLFSALSQGDIWIIFLGYHHSSHLITMALNTVSSTPTPTPTSNPTNTQTSNPTTNPTSTPTTQPSSTPTVPELSPLVVLPLIVVMLGLAIFAVKKRRSKPKMIT